MNILQFLKNGSGIHIKKKNRGSFTRWCGGNVTEECIRRGKASSNPKIRKKATFADNARHFKHRSGGQVVQDFRNKRKLESGGLLSSILGSASTFLQNKGQIDKNNKLINDYINQLYSQQLVPNVQIVPSDNPDIQQSSLDQIFANNVVQSPYKGNAIDQKLQLMNEVKRQSNLEKANNLGNFISGVGSAIIDKIWNK